MELFYIFVSVNKSHEKTKNNSMLACVSGFPTLSVVLSPFVNSEDINLYKQVKKYVLYSLQREVN